MMHAEAGKRIGHTAVCFDGKLVVWGGYNDERLHRNFPSNELWVYDPLIQKWSLWTCVDKSASGDHMPPGTSGATSCLIGCFMYLFGGYTMSGNVSTVYRIDLTPLCAGESAAGGRTLSIERLDPSNPDEAPIPSDKNVSWTHDGKFYVFGGYGYEPEWSHRHRGVMPRDCLFLPDPGSLWSSGASRRGWNNQLACFDPHTRCWSYPQAKGPWPAPRAAHAAAKIGSNVLIFGGRHDCQRVNDLWLLDMDRMAWRQLSCESAPEGRSWHSLTAISDTEVLLYGGLSNSRRPLADCFVFNLQRNRWIPVAMRPEPRLWHSAVFSERDRHVFIYGGGTSDILDHSIKTTETYTNDLITMRFSPDSLLHLSLDACTAHTVALKPLFAEMPTSLARVLSLRTQELATTTDE